MSKLLGAVAAALLAIMLLSPAAEARCWWNGYSWHCTHHRYHHVWRRHFYRAYYPPVYPSYYPYAYYPYYRPYYRAAYYCFPIWPFCA